MEILRWILAPGLAFLLGILYVNYLTVHPLRMSRFLLGASSALFLLLGLLALGFKGLEVALASLLALVTALGGYTAMARAVLSRQDPREMPRLERLAGDHGRGHTAVIYFTHGEPETYDPIGWINQFKEFDKHDIPFVPFLARPYFLNHLRKSYLKVGKSDHRRVHQQMLTSLERTFRTAGDTTTRFYLSFLDDDPRPDAAVIQALNDGASRIIVSEVFLTISNHTAEGKELIEELNVADYDVQLHYSGPLYDSETLKRMFVQRANNHLGDTAKAQVGILLVGHGQPDQWDAEWPTETAQEIKFRQDVLDLFERDGYKREHLSIAWMEFKEPKPASEVENLFRKGVEQVLYFSAAISADAIHSQYDVPALVSQARVREGYPLVNLGAWNDDPLVIQAIKEKIDAQLNRTS